MLIKTGVPTEEQVKEVFPPIERINKGRVAVAECFQRIPCNPCEYSCVKKAICVGEDINNTPNVDFEKCSGCGVCLTKCPGLAIMLVDGSKSAESVEFSVPYEFMPLPTVGEEISVVNRSGEVITRGVVSEVLNAKSFDRTPIVRFVVAREFLYAARYLKREVK
ncbi:MAG: 4Fe-4S binding protein [Clostridia bacterium]|nr:4Fe-4S binding protein [Clostridia bacterium]